MKVFFTNLVKSILIGMGVCCICFTVQSQRCGPEPGQEFIVKIEAEDFERGSTGDNAVRPAYPDGGCTNASGMFLYDVKANSWCEYDFDVMYEGTYELAVFYYSMNRRWIKFTVNGNEVYEFLGSETTSDWNCDAEAAACVKQSIYLHPGKNVLRLGGSSRDSESTGWAPNYDYFEIYTTDDMVIPDTIAPLYDWSYSMEIPKKTIQSNFMPEEAKNIFDGDEETAYEILSPMGATVEWAFTHPMSITGMLVYAEGDANVGEWKMWRSKDGEEWDPMGIFFKDTKGNSKVYGLDLDEYEYEENGGGSRKPEYRGDFVSQYFKVELPGFITLNELQLFGYPVQDPYLCFPEDIMGHNFLMTEDGQIDVGDETGELWATNEGLIEDPFYEVWTNAADRFPNMYTMVTGGEYENYVFEFGYDFFDFTDVKSYSLAVCEEKFPQRNPLSWTLYASGDFGESWDVLHEVEGFTWPVCDFVNMKFDVDEYESGSYFSYKFEMKGTIGQVVNISEFQLFGKTIAESIEDFNVGSNKSLIMNAQEMLVYSVKDGIVLARKNKETQAQYQIFGLNGQLLKQGYATTDHTAIPMKPGMYIVKVTASSSSEVTKVVVR